MSRLSQLTAGVALAVACTGAAARMHQICFEGPPQPSGAGSVSTAIFGCAIDGTGTCAISGRGLTERKAYPLSLGVQSPGTFAFFENAGTTPMTATITFVDNGTTVTRSCTVNPLGAANPGGQATPGAVLTGFSTDSSGLVTTGMWKLQAATDLAAHQLTLAVPGDFVAVGGGAMGTDSPTGALITDSRRQGNHISRETRSWTAATAEGGGAAQPHRATVFAIGLRIEGLTPQALDQLFVSRGWIAPGHFGTYSQFDSNPAAGDLAPSGSVVIGGSFTTYPFGNQYGTASAPLGNGYQQCDPSPNGGLECRFVLLNATGWWSESKDHVIAAPGWVVTQVMALPPTITWAAKRSTCRRGSSRRPRALPHIRPWT